MALLEALIGVGSGVAKHVVKLWFKDEVLLRESGLTVLDLFKKKTGDALAVREGNRQFERISEDVAQSLLRIFEREGVSIDENGQIAVALAAGETVQGTALTAEILLDRHLEPTRIEKIFLDVADGSDPTRDFSEAESELYRRIVSMTCQYIVDIASQMPQFQPRALAEVLRREDLILDKAEQILEELRRIGEVEDPSSRAARFEADYRAAVVRKLDHLELFGVDAAEHNRRYQLSVAYVSLSVERARREREDLQDSFPERLKLSRAEDLPAEEEDEEGFDLDDRETVSIETALASRRKLFIRGPAGSGKTTLLQWIAVESASRRMKGELADWNDMVPFFIRLREFTDQELPSPEAFPALITKAKAAEMPEGWLRQQLNFGRALVLVDGLDEIHRKRRREVRDWLVDLTATFPEACFVLSSRPPAVDEGWLDDEGFDEAELQAMSAHDTETFIDHWHRAVAEGLREEEEREELGSLAESLKKTVREDRTIRRLISSPLLCAMLCVLHRDRRQQLPKDRIELYAACRDMFLRRDEERRIAQDDYPVLSLRQKKALLENLASYLIANGWSEISEERADREIGRTLKGMEKLPANAQPESVRRLLAERSGMLRQPEAGVIDFAHRTFQEFLAAQAFLDKDMVGTLVRNAHDDQWREVVALAAGLARPAELGEIVEGVIGRGDEEADQRRRLYLLAAGCLETLVTVDRKVQDLVQSRLKKIVPPKNMTDAKLLAEVGDLVLPFLEWRRRGGAKNAACIRTLSLIGGDQAWLKLQPYFNDERVVVEKELGRLVRSFLESPEAFPSDAASWLVENKASWLENFLLGGNESLHLSGKSIRDITILSALLSLRSLNLHRTGVIDVSPLSGLSRLESLGLWGTGVIDVSPLSGLSSLQYLDLSYTNVMDVSALSGLSSLQSLDLGGTGVIDVTALSSLSSLQSLNLRGTGVADVSALSGLSSLQSLDLGGTGVADVSALSGLSSLQSLDLGGTGVADVSALSSLSSLQSLDLRGTGVADVSALSGLSSLQSLDLSYTDLIGVSALSGLSSLQSLNLGGTGVADVSALSGLSSLRSLDLWDTDVKDLSPLAGLSNLTVFGP